MNRFQRFRLRQNMTFSVTIASTLLSVAAAAIALRSRNRQEAPAWWATKWLQKAENDVNRARKRMYQQLASEITPEELERFEDYADSAINAIRESRDVATEIAVGKNRLLSQHSGSARHQRDLAPSST